MAHEQQLQEVERHLADALTLTRDTVSRCEQLLAQLVEALQQAVSLRPVGDIARCVAADKQPLETGNDDKLMNQLTARETEVLRLIAKGRSNRQIADALFLSARTVERHIANIYLKIDVHSKADATACAFRHGLAIETPV